MTLRGQLFLIVGASVVTVLVGTGVLVGVSSAVHAAHAELTDTNVDLQLEFELITAVQDYFGEERERFYGGEDAERTTDALERVNRSFDRLLNANAATGTGEETRERVEVRKGRDVFNALVADLEKLHAMPEEEGDAGNDQNGKARNGRAGNPHDGDPTAGSEQDTTEQGTDEHRNASHRITAGEDTDDYQNAHEQEAEGDENAVAEGDEDEDEREEFAEVLFEDRYERELLPLLHASVRNEQAQLASSMAVLDQRAKTGQWLAIVFAVLGLSIALGVVALAIRQLQRGVTALGHGVAGMGRGNLDTRIPTLRTVELDHLGQAFNKMAAELQRVEEAKRLRTEKLVAVGQLAASVGHEVRNPLSAARNAITYLNRVIPETSASENPRIGQFLQVADRELSVCNKIIEDLLNFARERPLNITACSVRPVMDEVLQVVRKPESTEVLVEIAPDLVDFDADRDQLRQLLGNLVQNAIEAVPAERNGVVKVCAQQVQDQIHISVEDNGEGISEDEQTRIFEPLVTTKTKGTGLGLAIASNIVRRHQGELDMVSEPGEGTTFTVILPLRQGEAGR